ncbi:MAG: ornithine cyclodeaminase family protein [Ruminococcaceae bacterium]|jgi:ornithine cyclodeaminase|nr:ornithine cyclodeaminase family protein [Oscillospiraceae bacterium]
MNKTLIVNRELCRQLLSLQDCIPAMSDVLIAASRGEVKMLQRSMIPHQSGNMLALMPATLLPLHVTGSKVIIFPGPKARKNGTNQGIVPLFDTETGALTAIVDAELITVVRTAATSAAATDALARKDARSVAILGAGNQGRAHAEAMTLIRHIEEIYIWDQFPAAVEAAVEHLSKRLPGVKLIPCATAEEAARNADILCTVTSSRGDTPFLKGEWLKPGAHLNAVGACSPTSREVDTETVRRCKVFLDWREAALRDAGDLIIPLTKGEITEDHFAGDVGKVLTGELPGRESDEEITMFETIGISVEDIAAAQLIADKARAAGLGVEVEI